MRRFSKKDFKKFPQRAEFAEFGSGKKPFVVCPVCHNVYYKKSWHADFPPDVLPEKRDIRFELCPADKMKKAGTFEGQIIIENAPASIKKEILNLAENSDHQARERDPQDRVLRVVERGKDIEIQTSENQLAVRIAKKIAQTFGKQKKPVIKYSREPHDVARVSLAL